MKTRDVGDLSPIRPKAAPSPVAYQPHLNADQRIRVARAEGSTAAQQASAPGSSARAKADRRARSKAAREAREVVQAAPLVTREAPQLGGLGGGASRFSLAEASKLLEVSERATEEIRGAAAGGARVGETLAKPLSAAPLAPGPLDAKDNRAVNAAVADAIVSALLPGPLQHGFKDATGRVHASRGRALGADLALLGAGVGGFIGGFTGEIGEGIAETVVDEAPIAEYVAAQRTRVADVRGAKARREELAEVKEAKTGRAQDPLGRALLLPGDVARSLRARAPNLEGDGRHEQAPAEAGEAGVGRQLADAGLVVEGGLRDEEGAQAADEPSAHGVVTRAGLLVASATAGVGGVVAAGRSRAKKVKDKLHGRARETGLPAMPAVPEARAPLDVAPAVPAFTDKAVPQMATPLSAFERMQAVAEGAKDKVASALAGLPEPATGSLVGAGLVATAIGGATAGGVLLAHEIAGKPRATTTRKRAAKKAAKKKPAKKKKAKAPKGATRVKSDTSGRTRTKNTWHGKPVFKDKNGRYFVVTNKPFKGARRFVKM